MLNIEKKYRLLFTGGGTAGHVTPNLTMMKEFATHDCYYVGSRTGVERQLLAKTDFNYHPIFCGKWRRYFSIQNLTDIVRFCLGVIQSSVFIWRWKPHLVFSKGGFVGLPVVIGAWLNRIPAICHESDISPGLANRIAVYYVDTVCVSFPVTKQRFSTVKHVHVTGSLLRQDLFFGDSRIGMKRCSFQQSKPVLLVMGGGLGASAINECLWAAREDLLPRFNIIHICGKGKQRNSCGKEGYISFEFLHEDYAHVLALADIVVARGGANTLFECLATTKPHVIIPLPLEASRGDQIHNARYFEKQGVTTVLQQSDMTQKTLLKTIFEVYEKRETVSAAIKSLDLPDGVAQVKALIEERIRA